MSLSGSNGTCALRARLNALPSLASPLTPYTVSWLRTRNRKFGRSSASSSAVPLVWRTTM